MWFAENLALAGIVSGSVIAVVIAVVVTVLVVISVKKKLQSSTKIKAMENEGEEGEDNTHDDNDESPVIKSQPCVKYQIPLSTFSPGTPCGFYSSEHSTEDDRPGTASNISFGIISPRKQSCGTLNLSRQTTTTTILSFSSEMPLPGSVDKGDYSNA